ncbi:hypothetical protein [Nitrosovibrio sp. Nv4]|uniref:hypothetical protein n=1 Tax=Nitrosovibrio sp. Nv4 TaxID=1945880 RepID=UPI000BD78FDD|nr:hypothetical protein [Nitrosovibrio sp. Nv4]SOD41310.1 hypothetical protein SAMN06298226_1605 [Nitrosovibrio sp. Nv4]
MTITSTTNRKEYTGNGATTSFSFPYYVLAAADLKVYQNGVLKTLTTHYTLSGTAPYTSGTNVQFVTAPASADEIVILRDPAITQPLDLVENDPLPAEELEKGYDRLTMVAQRLSERTDRSFHLSDTDVSGASLELPEPVAGRVIGWNSAADGLENKVSVGAVEVTTFMETLLDDADAATARATIGAVGLTGNETIGGNKTFSGVTEIGGTTTNDNAAAGQVGEYLSSVVLTPGVSLTSAVDKNVTSLTLTPGDWDLSGVIVFLTSALTSITTLVASSSTTTNTTDVNHSDSHATSAFVPGLINLGVSVPVRRVSIAAPTTYYLVASAAFSADTLTAFGRIQARRVR